MNKLITLDNLSKFKQNIDGRYQRLSDFKMINAETDLDEIKEPGSYFFQGGNYSQYAFPLVDKFPSISEHVISQIRTWDADSFIMYVYRWHNESQYNVEAFDIITQECLINIDANYGYDTPNVFKTYRSYLRKYDYDKKQYIYIWSKWYSEREYLKTQINVASSSIYNHIQKYFNVIGTISPSDLEGSVYDIFKDIITNPNLHYYAHDTWLVTVDFTTDDNFVTPNVKCQSGTYVYLKIYDDYDGETGQTVTIKKFDICKALGNDYATDEDIKNLF